jgi:hypothetical protein
MDRARHELLAGARLPEISTVLLVRHTVSTRRNTSSIFGAAADDAGKALLRRGAAQDDVFVTEAARLEQLPHLHRDEVDVAERLLEQRLGAATLRLAQSAESCVQCAVIIVTMTSGADRGST